MPCSLPDRSAVASVRVRCAHTAPIYFDDPALPLRPRREEIRFLIDRVKTETDAEGNVTSYSYDDAGNFIAVLDAEGHTTRFEYDAMNRRTAVIDATRGLMLGGPVAEPVIDSILWMVAIVAVFAPLAILRYRRRI